MSELDVQVERNHHELEEIHKEVDSIERKSTLIVRLLTTILIIFFLLIVLVFINGMFVHNQTGLNEINNNVGTDVINI